MEQVEGLFFRELMEQKELWVHILILAIAAAVLLHFADVFQNKGVSRISFCMIYMMLFLLLITSFQGSMEITTNVLDAMKDFMTVLAPAFFLAMTLTSYISSAGIYYEFTLFLISGVRWLTSVFLLPCIEIYILLVLVNHLSGEKRLGHLAELMSMLVGWSLKALLALVCGFHMVQGLISPAADAFRTMSVSRGIEAIPGVGDAGSSATELVLGSAMLIKNGIGAAALVVLLLLCLIPLAKLGIMMAAYYLLAAVLQPTRMLQASAAHSRTERMRVYLDFIAVSSMSSALAQKPQHLKTIHPKYTFCGSGCQSDGAERISSGGIGTLHKEQRHF